MRVLLIIAVLFNTSCSFSSGFEPWIKDDFFFHINGESREYKITPKRWSRPEVVVYDSNCILSPELFSVGADGKEIETLDWVVSVEVIKKGKILEKFELGLDAGWPDSKNCMNAISLGSLKSISGEAFPSEALIRITVIKSTRKYQGKYNALKIGIRNSPVP